VQIQSQLNDAEENIYTTKILDFIVPETKYRNNKKGPDEWASNLPVSETEGPNAHFLALEVTCGPFKVLSVLHES